MAPFFRGLVRFFSHKNGNDTSLSEISNDDLTIAYEWAQHGDGFDHKGVHYADMRLMPRRVRATIRKLEVASEAA